MSDDRYYLGEGRIGYLSVKDLNRARWAYDYQRSFCTWLRVAGYIDFDEKVIVQSSTDGHIGIPATKLAYLEIQRLVHELNAYPTIEDAAQDREAAEIADMLGREVQTAVYRWPMEDKPHKINVLRCGGCGMLTLMYRPPRFDGDRIIVDCQCGYLLDEDQFAWAVRHIEGELNERQALVDDPGSAAESA